MDFIFDQLPSTSQSTPKPRHQPSETDPDEGLGSGFDFDSTERSGSLIIDESQDQQLKHGSGIDDISKRVEDLIGKINDRRTADQKIFDNFQEKLVEKVTKSCEQMKEHMYTVYEENSLAMQAKLQEVSEVLESCSKLTAELQGAGRALEGLNVGLSQAAEP